MDLTHIFHHKSDNSVMEHPKEAMAATHHTTIQDFQFTPENQSQWIASQKVGQTKGFFTFQGKTIPYKSPLAARLRQKANFVYQDKLSNENADKVINNIDEQIRRGIEKAKAAQGNQ